MISDNQINFFGDPIASDDRKSKFVACCQGPDGTVSIVGAFLALAAAMCTPALSSSATALVVVGSLLALSSPLWFGLRRLEERVGWFCAAAFWGEKRGAAEKTCLKKKTINTRPDKSSVPTDQKWMRFARRAQIVHAFFLFGAMAQSAWLLREYSVGQVLPDALCGASVAFPAAMRAVCGLHRWAKVLNREWVIEDKAPSPKRVPAREKIKKMLGIFSPAQSPAALGA